MSLTIEQQIARKQNELALLKAKKDKLLTRQKIIVGAVMINDALDNAAVAQKLIEALERDVIRKSDKEAIASLIEQLQASITEQLTH